ncbi:hypothetical protein [Candidatus Ruminimicrobiellum ovillum]|uniref:hypothetical protein n=1 Tax=Candidatus Ruminimicrobiellum ovillum TaxID=1947927 RepID=UPI0035598501
MNQSKRVLIFILNLMFSLFIAYLVYNYIYGSYDKEFKERKSVYERFSNINSQLDDFNSIQTKMDELDESLAEVFSIYKDTFYSNEQNINAYKVRILELLKETDIHMGKDDSIVQEKKDNSIEITLKIKATYKQICKFLFELERYSKVLSLVMDYKGNVEIKTVPILFSSEVNDCFSGRNTIDFIEDDIRKAGYFKEISDKIEKAKDVGYIQTWRDFEPIPKTPFYFYVPEKTVKSGGGGAVKVEKPNIVIDGIMYEKQHPMAIIGGKFYYVGDVYNGFKITQINGNNIKVSKYGSVFTIKMEN